MGDARAQAMRREVARYVREYADYDSQHDTNCH